MEKPIKLASKVSRKRPEFNSRTHFKFSPPNKLHQKFIVTPEYDSLPLKL